MTVLSNKNQNSSRQVRLTKRTKLSDQPKTPVKSIKSQSNVVQTTPTKVVGTMEPRTPVQALREAKQRFRRCSTPKKLIGREKERSTITEFITDNVIGKQGNSLYISGCPGTGKTALVTEILNNFAVPVHSTIVNCMNFDDSKKLYLHLLLEWKLSYKDGVDGREILRNYLATCDAVHCLVLDEIDQLCSRENDVLYSLFEWAHTFKSIVIIGIANALDLTSRFLPRLISKGFNPQALTFEPYKINEITAIIKDRLSGIESPVKNQNGESEVMQPIAIEMAARKIAGTGDLRKALDVCRQALQTVEKENKEGRVTVKHIVKAAKDMLGSPIIETIRQLNMPSKMVLCTVYLMSKIYAKVEVQLVENNYRMICKFHKVGAITTTELDDVIHNLESSALFCVVRKPKTKNGVVTLNISEQDLFKGVKDSVLLEVILENGPDVLSKPK